MLKQKKGVNRFAAAAAASRQPIYVENSLNSEYPTRLNFYLKPPPAEITIEELELFALDRLQVLKAIENAALRNKRGADFNRDIDQVLEKHLPLKSNLSRSPNLFEERRKDHISHFILRLAYCRSEESRAWFLRQECLLFKHRFEQETLEDKKAFLASLNLNWKVLTSKEKERIQEQLEQCSTWLAVKHQTTTRTFVQNETFFEVDFEKVPDLLSRRHVYVTRGKAYIPITEQISLVMEEFRNRLSQALEATAKALPRMEEDDRLKPILLNVEKQYMGKTYGDTDESTGTVKAADVNTLVEKYAPLCMQHLNQALHRDHHLRHGGRMQYGLFLKAIGLSIDEALVFWRTLFSNITDDKFQKEYAYNIRHNYGLEGKRVSYAPYSCMKIIQGNPPSTGDHHGCPFKHFSQTNLEARLHKNGISQQHISEITNLVRDRHYQVACTRYFEVTHPEHTDKVEVIEHPNQYYEMSRNLQAS
ncbi:DNA primase large subunit Spp2 [Radiomyces spectabilis]|uniref:DNA primase large subunit Spp2 n=1 Tax=Radiomyces spectabilis TaxID=64574 RepID=UPI00221E4515|nr:DNA primase large subunit Spp2 [Radiomyces spectabilis]KAI8369573.1 DNA primase large subunit Spp2 [Radiomyces spectabilis]